MKNGVAVVLLAAILWLGSAAPALAGPQWCEDDPVVHFDWGSVHLSTTFYGDPTNVLVTYTVYGPTAISITYPQAGNVPSLVVWVSSPDLPAGSAQILVSITNAYSGATKGTGTAGKFSYTVGTLFTVNTQDY